MERKEKKRKKERKKKERRKGNQIKFLFCPIFIEKMFFLSSCLNKKEEKIKRRN